MEAARIFSKPGKRKYLRKRETERARNAAASRTGRDVGPTAAIADLARRERCRLSLRLFCETYNHAAFHWPWSPDHLAVIRAIEESVSAGALLAFAMPRGCGKTTICRMAVLWAVSYAHIQYCFLIGANESKAVEALDSIKTMMRFLDPYILDFPEISSAAKQIGGIANRASGQLAEGNPTLIKWERTRVVLPRMAPPLNLPQESGGGGQFARTSGTVIGVSGLTGDGIRGSLFTHPDGRMIRPDLVLLDDPQTDESAASLTQNESREQLISGAVLGMAGPGKSISAVMPCTVIRRGDMVDRILDRQKHPLWRGVRTKLMPSMPKRMDEWEKYFEVYRACMGQDKPNAKPAAAYYRRHRKVLDEGAEASWKQRKREDEVSAVQHAMNLYCRDPRRFFAEYQNEPMREDRQQALLDPEKIAAKLSGLERGRVPKLAQYLTAYVDVHERLLYYVVSAWSPQFAGGPIEYGTYPEQPVAYFAQSSAPIGMAAVHPGTVEDAWIVAGLTALVNSLLAKTFPREDGAAMRIGRLLIDAKWGQKTELVKTFCRRHPQSGSIVLPAMGIAHFDYKSKPGTLDGLHWRLAPPDRGDRIVFIETNWWKTLTEERLAMPTGTPGGWELFGSDIRIHCLFADHCVAEEHDRVLNLKTSEQRDVWKWKPTRPDNHYWDCLVGSAAAASMLGAAPAGLESSAATPPRRSWFSQQKRRNA